MKALLMVGLISAAVVSGWAQGTISVGNGISGTRFPIYDWDGNLVGGQNGYGNTALSQPPGANVYGGPLLQGSRYQIEFWAGPASATSFSELSLITTMSFRTATGDVLPAGLTATVLGVVPGVPAGVLARLGVRVWDTQDGPTYFASTVRGASLLYLSAELGGGLNLPPNWVGESFSIVFIPEPTTFSLALVGAASCLLFRQRK